MECSRTGVEGGTRVILPGPGLSREPRDHFDTRPVPRRADASEVWRSKEAEADGALVR